MSWCATVDSASDRPSDRRLGTGSPPIGSTSGRRRRPWRFRDVPRRLLRVELPHGADDLLRGRPGRARIVEDLPCPLHDVRAGEGALPGLPPASIVLKRSTGPPSASIGFGATFKVRTGTVEETVTDSTRGSGMDARIWELDNTSKDSPSYETDDLSEDHFGIRFQPLGQPDLQVLLPWHQVKRIERTVTDEALVGWAAQTPTSPEDPR